MHFAGLDLAKRTVLLIFVALGAAGCAREEGPSSATAPKAVPASSAAPAVATLLALPTASGRKVIRRAELGIEVGSVGRAQSEITRIAESAGGYVAATAREVRAEAGERAASRVTLTLRVPSETLSAVLERIKRLGTGTETERISSEDATDEYVDLEARIENQRRLEQQFIEILSSAKTVADALNVQRELSTVRTDLDRMEGRRRFISQAAALSSIEVTGSTVRPLVTASFSDFEVSALRAYSDAISVGAGLVSGAIRLLGVILPLALILGVPAFALVRGVRRFARRKQAVYMAP